MYVAVLQEKLVANKDVRQLVALLSSDEDRLPALQEYIHEHLHGAEMVGATPKSVRDVIDEKKPRVVVFAGESFLPWTVVQGMPFCDLEKSARSLLNSHSLHGALTWSSLNSAG